MRVYGRFERRVYLFYVNRKYYNCTMFMKNYIRLICILCTYILSDDKNKIRNFKHFGDLHILYFGGGGWSPQERVVVAVEFERRLGRVQVNKIVACRSTWLIKDILKYIKKNYIDKYYVVIRWTAVTGVRSLLYCSNHNII